VRAMASYGCGGSGARGWWCGGKKRYLSTRCQDIVVPAASVLCERWRAIGAGVVRGVGGVGVELAVVLSTICMFT
jgi:hypothetical protein